MHLVLDIVILFFIAPHLILLSTKSIRSKISKTLTLLKGQEVPEVAIFSPKLAIFREELPGVL